MKSNQIHITRELFDLIAEDDHEAFKMLVNSYRDTVFSHAIAYLKDFYKAQDVTQDVFLIIWDGRRSLRKVVNPENYMFILTRNRIVAEFRNKVKLSVLEDLDLPAAGADQLPNQLLEKKEMGALIQAAVSKMTFQQRNVFELGKMEGLKYEEIAERLKISPNTVRVHMVQALSFIRTFMRNEGIFLLFFFFF